MDEVNPPEPHTNTPEDHIIDWTSRLSDASTGKEHRDSGWNGATAATFLSQNQIGISSGETNLYRYVRNRPMVARDPAGLNITLETGNNSRWQVINNIVHQQVCVTCGRDKTKQCFSFAMTRPQMPQFSRTWLGWRSRVFAAGLQGKIYSVAAVPGARIVSTHITTIIQDNNWLNYMATRVGTTDAYSIARHNCRKYSQMEFADAPLHW